MVTSERLSYLLEQLEAQSATREEYRELRELLNADSTQSILARLQSIYPFEDMATADSFFRDPYWQEILQQVLAADKTAPTADLKSAANSLSAIPPSSAGDILPVRRIHFLRTAWFKYAAAILIIFGSVAYLWINNRNDKDLATTIDSKRLQTDVAPGGEKAVLTLADGTKIILDSAANGNLAQQGNAQVVKLSNGQIAYNLKGKSVKEIMWNTMSTPAGGQYQLTLPDGTMAWLNAASSITYPAVFAQKERNITVSGEVYLEVAKDNGKPFTVSTPTDKIAVLGTTFNINCYADEPVAKTTLLKGAVRINEQLLKPGEAYNNGKIIKTDPAQDVAWKNGVFNFTNMDVPAVFRQLARWYDLDVRFEGTPPAKKFKGEMSRNLPLSEVLELLSALNLQFSIDAIDGKVLTVKGL